MIPESRYLEFQCLLYCLVKTTTHFSSTKLTDLDGKFIYEFKSLAPLPPLSDKSSWGNLNVQLSSDSNFIDPVSLSKLNLEGNLDINYEVKSDNSFFQSTIFGLGFILLVSLLVSVFILLNRRKMSEMSEIAGIFNYAQNFLKQEMK